MSNHSLLAMLFVFAMICVFVVGFGYVMISLDKQGDAVTDTYGTAQSAQTNESHGFVKDVATGAGAANQGLVWFGVLAIVVASIMMAVWAYQTFGRSGSSRGRGW